MEITAKQVAKILGVSHRRVLALIKAGRIKSRQVGGMHLIRKQPFGVKVKPRKKGDGGPPATWETGGGDD